MATTQILPQQCLIIFSRYPEAGKTKTRMIPALGAEGAANLQRRMTEHTLAQAKELQDLMAVTVEVHFAGGNQSLMTQWLGLDTVCKPQSSGDLGTRMASAFTNAFAAGMERVVMIGIDCPDIDGKLLQEAFNHLQNQDLVLGEAEDGGYYLIGLSGYQKELFTGISWGTGEVFQQTIDVANKLNLSTAYLKVLNDVDRPEDLPIWLKYGDQ